MKKNHIYPGANALNIYLTINDCNKAIEFYKKAFNAKEKYRLLMPDGLTGHAEIEIEGNLLMMAEENADWGTTSPVTLGGNPITLCLYVQDVDTFVQNAISEGATMTMPVKNEFYGDRAGQILDPFGYKWKIATHIESLSPEEMQKRMDLLFKNYEQN